MAYDLTDAVTVKQLQKSYKKSDDKIKALSETVSNRIASVYKIKGTLAFAALTSALLVKANEGNVYNISDEFTTTADFIEGAGKKHTAGSNVVIVEATPAVYTASSDTSVTAGKTYYVNRNGGYAAVTPTGSENPSTAGYFEQTTPAVYKFDVHGGDLSGVQTLAVPTKARNIALLDANGQVIDSTIAIATDEEVDEMLAEVDGE